MSDSAYERLSQLDNSFLIYEDSGPAGHMHVGATLVYEAAPLRAGQGGFDFDRLRAYVASRLHRLPRYRQRLARIPLEGHPIWVDDPHFNLDYHLRQTRLPRPGSERILKRTVGRIMSQRLDRAKPLWEMWVIEGVEGDRVAVVSKNHHCVIDGIAGVDLMSTLMTTAPTERIGPAPPWVPQPAPGALELLSSAAWLRARAPIRLAQILSRLVRDEARARPDFVRRLRAAGRFVASGLAPASDTPINGPIGCYRRFDWTSLDLAAARAVKQRLGGSVNDVVLATVAGALRRFLTDARGVAVDGLDFRVMTPVNVRGDRERSATGNRVSAWILRLPLDEPDPLRRLRAIRETTERLKKTRQALGAETLTLLGEWTGGAPLALGARLAAWARPFNLVVTNVPGPQTPLFLMGSRLLAAYPMLPLFANLATGIALFSYAGQLQLGVMADWDRLPDLHDLTLAIGASFGELCEAAGVAAAGAREPVAVPVRSDRHGPASVIP